MFFISKLKFLGNSFFFSSSSSILIHTKPYPTRITKSRPKKRKRKKNEREIEITNIDHGLYHKRETSTRGQRPCRPEEKLDGEQVAEFYWTLSEDPWSPGCQSERLHAEWTCTVSCKGQCGPQWISSPSLRSPSLLRWQSPPLMPS